MAAKYPHLVRPLHVSSPKPEGKIRVGFVSPHMKAHSLGELYIGWLRHSDPALLEMYCYYLGEVEDSLTQEFGRYSHVFRKLAGSIEAIAAQILSDELHVVIFPEISLEATTVQLAALRLAPIQCATWIHPVTSGLPTVDYFLSSELMEPSNGREHYTETLVPLPNLGISYPKPQLPQLSKGRDFFGLCEDSVVYLACQSLMKYLPQHDGAYARILRDVPQSQIVFIAHPSDRITEQFQLRLARTFEQFGLDMRDRCIIAPRLAERDYLNLNQLADVFLDSFSWSGGITTLKAIAYGLPVVTCPGDLMRGRHSYAILQMLGITETIARTEDEYVDVSVRLGVDLTWRQQIKEQMEQQRDLLYDDRECIRAFEEFCSTTARRSSLKM
ncbi:hypothetical protein HC928_10910 [bacterium]|nr:hypothetical protein [bacterium]